MQLSSLKIATKKPVCKICFEEFIPQSFQNFYDNPEICPACRKKIQRIYHFYKIEGVQVNALFLYENPLGEWLFQYKESMDIELKNIFLKDLNTILSFMYIGYYLVLMPSSKDNLKRRGFNHLLEIFNNLNIKMIEDLLIKKDNVDQKKLNKKEREKHKDFIGANDLLRISGKKILLVDDVISTGNSIKQSLKVLKEGNPKKIKILIIAENK